MKDKLLTLSLNMLLSVFALISILGITGVITLQTLETINLQVLSGIAFLGGSILMVMYKFNLAARVHTYAPQVRLFLKNFSSKKLSNNEVYFPLAIGFLSGAIVYFRWASLIGRFTTLFSIVIASLVFFFSCLIMRDKSEK